MTIAQYAKRAIATDMNDNGPEEVMALQEKDSMAVMERIVMHGLVASLKVYPFDLATISRRQDNTINKDRKKDEEQISIFDPVTGEEEIPDMETFEFDPNLARLPKRERYQDTGSLVLLSSPSPSFSYYSATTGSAAIPIDNATEDAGNKHTNRYQPLYKETQSQMHRSGKVVFVVIAVITLTLFTVRFTKNDVYYMRLAFVIPRSMFFVLAACVLRLRHTRVVVW